MKLEESYNFLTRYFADQIDSSKSQWGNVLCWGWGSYVNVLAESGCTLTVIEGDSAVYAEAVSDYKLGLPKFIHHKSFDEGYVTFPLLEDNKYDLIFIGDEMSLDCLLIAKQVVSGYGMIVISADNKAKCAHVVREFPWVRDYESIFLMSNNKEESRKIMRGFKLDEDSTRNTTMGMQETLLELYKRMTSGKPFTYLRFGDADLHFIDDINCRLNKRHDPNPNMSKELESSFKVEDPDYLLGGVVNAGIFKKKESKLHEISQKFHSGRTYYSAVCFHTMYCDGPEPSEDCATKHKFVDYVKDCFWDRKVLFIGGKSVAGNPLVQKVFNVAHTIEFSDRNAYSMLDAKQKEIERCVDDYDILVVALGQATRCLGWRLWDAGIRTQYFDVGSTVDALSERHLRSWIKNNSKKVEVYKKIFL